MKFLLGSNFWKLNTKDSDNDYMEFVFPTKEDLFKGNFTSKQFKDNNGDDVNLKDVRMLLKELKKGSVKAFECLYSTEVEFSTDLRFLRLWDFLRDNRDNLFEELTGQFKKACFGELCNRLNRFKSDLSNTKELAHCFKLNYLLSNDNAYKSWFENKAYETGLEFRTCTNLERKKELLEQYELLKNDLSKTKFELKTETPTVDKLEKLLTELCFEL